MRRTKLLIALGPAAALVGLFARSAPSRAEQPYSLAGQARLGASTIHRYVDQRVVPSRIALSVFTPLPSANLPGKVVNLNGCGSGVLPERCVIGDGGTTRAFLGIDRRQGTPLDRKLDQIVAKIPRGPQGFSLDGVVEHLRANVNQLIRWTPGSAFNDGRAELPWDRSICITPSASATLRAAENDAVGSGPRDTGDSFPVVPFERYLDKGQGYCIQKALLASLVLSKLGFSHRLVNGVVCQGPGRTTGHTWLELPDGRVFDPAWASVGRPQPASVSLPGAFCYGGQDRFADQYYPCLVCD